MLVPFGHENVLPTTPENGMLKMRLQGAGFFGSTLRRVSA